MEGSIGFLEEFIISVGGNRFVINTAIKPGMQYAERNANLLSYLKESADSTEYISAIYVYEKESNAMLSSDGVMTGVDYASNAESIRTCVSGWQCSMLSSKAYRYDTYLSYVDDSIFLVHTSIPIRDNFHLFVIAELNKKTLFKSAYEICRQTSNCLSIADSNNSIILDTQLSPETMKLNNTVNFHSKYPSWDYRFYMPQAPLPPAKYYLLAVLPFSIALLLITIILVPYIAWRVYSPIWKLVQNVSNYKRPFEPKASGEIYVNEIDYLLSTYDAAIQDRDAVLTLVREVRTELEERLLTNLINGVDYSGSELRSKLRNMCSSCSISDKYQVILAYPRLDGGSENDVNRQIILYQLKELVQNSNLAGQATLFFLLGVKAYGIVILCYPASSTNDVNRSVSNQIIEEMKNFVLQQSTNVLFSSGRVFSNLGDIRLSFDSAEGHIRYQIYFAEEPGETDAALNTLTDNGQPGFEQHLEFFIDHVRRYEFNKVEEMLVMVLDQIALSETDLDTKKQQYANLLNALAERALMPRRKDYTIKWQWLGKIYTDLKNINIQEHLGEKVYYAAQELLKLIKDDSIIKQNRRVMRAKECIENNYANSDLSADVIAEEIGISASYLSKIFVEYAGENLVGYLNSYRVDMAKELLSNTNIMIRDIGYKTGFNTIQNFNRVFKRYVGITPSQFRSKFYNG